MFKVIEIQATPNPNALKFILDHVISEQPASFIHADAAANHPIASKLFAIKGVKSVLILRDFVTVNKEPGEKWAAIRRKAKAILECA
jgi:hypothetical protein